MKRVNWALTCLAIWPVIQAAEPQSSKSEPPPVWLLDVVSARKPLYRESASHFFAYVRDELKHDIEIDSRGLEKVLGRKPGHVQLTVRCQHEPIGLTIERVANRLGGTLAWDGDRVKIVPGSSRGYPRFLKPATKKTLARMDAKIEFAKGITEAPLKDVLAFLSDKCDITILIDESEIGREEGGALADRCVSLPAGNNTLGRLLRQLTRTIGCTVRVFDELILIVPPSGKIA